jgi:K(+)-stimulated pyrophosphate-energized sodium pump
MAADIFESYEVTIISGLILGLVLYRLTGEPRWVIFPMLVRAIGVAASIVGTYLVGARKGRANGNAMVAISTGFYTSAGISLPAIALLAVFYMGEWHAAISVALGIGLALGIDELTKAFTDTARRPVKTIAMASQTGSATLILRGLGVGFESAVWQMLAVAAAILGSIIIHWGLPVSYVLYGIAMTGIGMLTLTGNNVAMDSFGPISDNASGIGEMTHLKPQARQILAHLDEVGNTTKAITKGVAIGSAALAAVSLFSSFLTDITRVQQQLGLAQAQWLLSTGIRVSSPGVFIALLAGGALPWLFSSLTINAVARAASLIVEEVRRQLHIPGLLQGKVKPDYEKAVGICTAAAQRELLALALITITAPLLIGMLLGVEELGGFLAGAILSGQLLAVFMATAGGAWDNAKKSIEDGQYGGKGSEAHKASVVGDTVGDPLKDTAGPALNPMLKVINLVSLIAAPLLVHFRTMSPGLIAAAAACLVLFIGSIAYSKGENARKKLTGL